MALQMGPLWDLYTKCLDPTDNMNVFRAQRILSLAPTPTKESDEALEQVHADHRGETYDVSHSDSYVLSPQIQQSVRTTTLIKQDNQGSTPEGYEALPGAAGYALLEKTTSSYIPSPQSVRPEPILSGLPR